MSKEYDVCLESDLPIVQQQGLNTNKNAFLGGTLNVTGAASFNSTVSVTGAFSSAAGLAAFSGTAISATASEGVAFSSTNTFGIYYGSGVPSAAAATGSLYLRSDGSNASNRAYISSGGTAWTAVVTIA